MEIDFPDWFRRLICRVRDHRWTHYKRETFHVGEAVAVTYTRWCGLCGRWEV